MHGLTAGDVQHGAVDGGHPQVGGARVEHHGEGLGGRSQADLAVVLGLLGNNGQKGKAENKKQKIEQKIKLSGLTNRPELTRFRRGKLARLLMNT